jgi:hypothetical protein
VSEMTGRLTLRMIGIFVEVVVEVRRLADLGHLVCAKQSLLEHP